MGLLKRVSTWSYDVLLDYISVNPTRDEVTHFKVDPHDESDESILKLRTVKDFGSITCLDFSESEIGMVGVGEKSGHARLLNIIKSNDNEYNNFDVTVRAKQMRCINTLVINTNGLVAIGLDRNRNDASLQIWDANYQSTSSDIINPTFSYCINESIVSLRFLQDTSILAASTKFLKEIDIRSSNPVYQLPTRLSYDIKLNPFNSWQFSTYGDDGTLAIWDRRKLTSHDTLNDPSIAQPLISFDKLVGTGAASKKYMNSCFRWSTVRNWEFATLHQGDTIKRWRLGSCLENDDKNEEYEELFVSTVHDINTTFDRVVTFDYIPKENNMVSFFCMRQSGTVYRMPILQSYSTTVFDSYNSLMLSNCEVPILDEMRISKNEEKSNSQRVERTLQNLSFEDLDVADNGPNLENIQVEYTNETDEEGISDEEDSHDDGHSTEKSFDYKILWKPKKLLQQDISVIMRTRAKLGYGLDPMTTVERIDDSSGLENYSYIRNTWRWIAIAKAAVEEGSMASKNLDLGYEGILGIWNGLSGISTQRRYSQDVILTDKQLNKEMDKIIKSRNKNKSNIGQKNPLNKFSDSPKNIQRKLCLIMSGWDLVPGDYEEKYDKIIKSNNYEKAAAWAVFFGDIPKAVEILSSAKKERLQLIATAISGYMAYKDQPGNNSWRQQCRKMSSEFEDPYLRVIFAFIADNDWWDILYEPAISLRERLGVALRFLNDADLTTFLERTSSSVIANGELEGLILTGITPSGIDLLQSYVNKTSDVQSAALISIFGSPRYFKDKRVDCWVQSYRYMLNSWELFSMRAKFDVLRSKLSKTRTGVITAEIKPRQLYIQCVNCKANINKPNSSGRNAVIAGSNQDLVSSNTAIGSDALAFRGKNLHAKKVFGTTPSSPLEKHKQKHSCPHCGAPFPRCAICLLPLGTSNLPFTISGIDDTQNTNEPKNEGLNDISETEEELKYMKRLRLNEWFSFCLSCNHGMHAGHADEWFARHNVCPVPGCNCQCHINK
ncbi:hypothetical protein Kpol_520p18 [Vanderwaltozyma polyspora DSM 70294]|uniref:Uncharacterized protein n=1 Tax=Vanderwaltozyma polyspora (strain ATCC 22028 / DSM 70294 / BCRC 21397 / CBS 2163 / NBRC 10782 / NRRL Y-8283 / UCD 57-17) TaxID=436907 RepID=A7TMA3_VANPO|nr:uncharacterized protein Kpol_520p18 [Vanderwaltozyma polyspora DSM 70294]EDO16597.1 hypothetical protein Kpol_520p18 [Vanderwaltozyma polyspora DSM 70294]